MSTAILPAARPRLASLELDKMLATRGFYTIRELVALSGLAVIGIRGYYRDTMGAAGRNDRMIYDDAIILVTENAFVTFNANTDPSGYRKGKGTGDAKGIASLNPGFWPVYRFDLHRGKYLALCQRAGKVTVTRDGDPPYQETSADLGINIHKGGTNTTSSLGCQTIPPQQWDAFITLASTEMKRVHGDKWKRQNVPYVLMEA